MNVRNIHDTMAIETATIKTAINILRNEGMGRNCLSHPCVLDTADNSVKFMNALAERKAHLTYIRNAAIRALGIIHSEMGDII